MNQEFKFPVYATQGGGLARRGGESFFFVTKPECPGLDVGDKVPNEWDLIAANEKARREIAADEWSS